MANEAEENGQLGKIESLLPNFDLIIEPFLGLVYQLKIMLNFFSTNKSKYFLIRLCGVAVVYFFLKL